MKKNLQINELYIDIYQQQNLEPLDPGSSSYFVIILQLTVIFSHNYEISF